MDLFDCRRPVDAARIAFAGRLRVQGNPASTEPRASNDVARGCASGAATCPRRSGATPPAAARLARPRRARGRRDGVDRASGLGRSALSGSLELHSPIRRRSSGCAATSGLLARPAVAIVGSRAATPYALDVAYRLGQELADRGIVVASGLARGVDSAAHRGCLSGGGADVAVLGSGLDRIYPAEHAELAREISAERACWSASSGPARAPLPEHFPLRNRIISGISLAVVVVEASEKSGSLITARCALEQGRDVMAVPGQRPDRPQPRLAQPAEGRGKGRRVCGRYS